MSSASDNKGSAVAPPRSDKNESRSASAILLLTPWQPPVAVSGKGIYITLEDGRVVIDAAGGGTSAACIGNGHPVVREAIKEQIDKLAYVYNMQLSNAPAEELASMLIESGKGAFELCGFAAGGSEAMEAAIKLSRQYWYEQNQPQRRHFISRHMSFHGNTVAALSLSGHISGRAPYEEILQHENIHMVSPAFAKRFQRADETEDQYVERLRQELEDKFLELGPDTVIGFVAETVAGASGVIPAPKGYFKAMKSVCRKYGALFILDEVTCGMGRMGVTHAWELYGDNEPPDIQAIGKGLGAGYACIAAVLMSKQIADGIRDKNGFWKHGHTYQAQPISCAAAVAVQKVIAAENLLENGRQTGEYLAQLLRERLLSHDALAKPFTFDIRGGGSFWAVEFDFTGPEGKREDFKGQLFARLVQVRCFEKGLVVGASSGGNAQGVEGDEVIFAPAYNTTREEVEKVVDIFVESVEDVLREHTHT
ncbi:PLP-dependent transferase [Lactarius quietus]|nr:PLP-dependent transferase [Lactarius quietus]